MKYVKKTYHRNLIERELKNNAHLIKGSILDIGSKDRKYDHLFSGKVTACDIKPDREKDIIEENVISLSFDNKSFDACLCLEVLEYLDVNDFKKALMEIRRVTKGMCLITLPFCYKDHEDKLRVTFSYLESILKEMNIDYEIKKIGNRFTSSYDVTRYSFLKNRLVFPLLLLKFLLIKIFSLDKKQDDFYSGLFIKLL